MGKLRRKKRKTKTATLYDFNNELCDYVIDMERLNDEFMTLTDDQKTVLKALMDIAEMQDKGKRGQ